MNEEEFDDSFYVKFLNYLEEKHYLGAGFHWSSDIYQEYYWWIEDRNLGRKGLLTLKELVEDVLSGFLNVKSHD